MKMIQAFFFPHYNGQKYSEQAVKTLLKFSQLALTGSNHAYTFFS